MHVATENTLALNRLHLGSPTLSLFSRLLFVRLFLGLLLLFLCYHCLLDLPLLCCLFLGGRFRNHVVEARVLRVTLVVVGSLARLDLSADFVENDVADTVNALLVGAIAVPDRDEIAVEAD